MALLSLAALGVAIVLGLLLLKLKQVEEALRQSEASLLQVQRIAHLGSWELDLATQQLTWSEEMFRIAGIAPTARGALGLLVSGTYHDRPEKAQHMLNIAASNSERLVRLVNDILDLERLESGKVKLIKQPYPVRELLQQAIDSVHAIADRSAIHLSFTVPDGTVWVAPDAIVQTLTNLLSNAIKFSPAGGKVWVKVEEVGKIGVRSQKQGGRFPTSLVGNRYYLTPNRGLGSLKATLFFPLPIAVMAFLPISWR